MRAMSLCESIIVLDSFTWWSAYLSTGKDADQNTVDVVMVDEWVTDSGEVFDARRMALAHWQVVELES